MNEKSKHFREFSQLFEPETYALMHKRERKKCLWNFLVSYERFCFEYFKIKKSPATTKKVLTKLHFNGQQCCFLSRHLDITDFSRSLHDSSQLHDSQIKRIS